MLIESDVKEESLQELINAIDIQNLEPAEWSESDSLSEEELQGAATAERSHKLDSEFESVRHHRTFKVTRGDALFT
jgi:hypothetical protein